MHDLAQRYARVLDILSTAAPDSFTFDGNHRRYPRPPKMTDLEVVALAVTAESLQIDSEALLWAKLADYPALLPHRGHRASFNRRRRRLGALTNRIHGAIADFIDLGGDVLLFDSIPVETARLTHERRSRACRRPGLDAVRADKTYHASTKRYLVGFKVHLICTLSGVYVDHVISPASHHDARVLAELVDDAENGALDDGMRARLHNRVILADKAYDAAALQLRLFEATGAHLKAQRRERNRNWEPWPYELKRARGYVETVFAQLCDEVNLKRNRAKRFSGFNARISAKLLTRTVEQYINFHTGHPLNQTKYCWIN